MTSLSLCFTQSCQFCPFRPAPGCTGSREVTLVPELLTPGKTTGMRSAGGAPASAASTACPACTRNLSAPAASLTSVALETHSKEG